jgi:Cu(I)/Ag(I) efflux system protein CusF
MRQLSLALATVLALMASPAIACDDHAPGTEPAKPSLSRQSAWVDGEVREMDRDDGSVTLGHRKITRWRMDSMSSMVFKAHDPALLAKLNPGDKIKFRAAMLGQQPVVIDVKTASN